MRAPSFVLVVIVSLAASSALAADFAVNAGFTEVVGVPHPTHLGLYPYVGGSVAVPVGPATLIPQVALEWAPENGHAGLVGALTADFAVVDGLGLDVGLAFIHDQDRFDFSSSAYLAGAGVGFSLLAGAWTFSPFVNLFMSTTDHSLRLVPGVNVARAL